MRLLSATNLRCAPSSNSRLKRGFTLVEVVLAIIITIGILTVALYFYQQSTRLRSELLEESERLSAIRLLMDRISNDLRSAMVQPQAPFIGESTAMRFVKAGIPSPSAMTDLGVASAGVQTDLRKVTYGVQMSQEGTNRIVRGVTRIDEPMVEFKVRRDPTAAIPVPQPPADLLNARPSTNGIEVASQSAPTEPLTDRIRYLHFSYYDGAAWSENWLGGGLPKGVEVTLSLDSLPEGLDPSDGSAEIFRRVIVLPGAGREPAPRSSGGASGASQPSGSPLAEVAP